MEGERMPCLLKQGVARRTAAAEVKCKLSIAWRTGTVLVMLGEESQMNRDRSRSVSGSADHLAVLNSAPDERVF